MRRQMTVPAAARTEQDGTRGMARQSMLFAESVQELISWRSARRPAGSQLHAYPVELASIDSWSFSRSMRAHRSGASFAGVAEPWTSRESLRGMSVHPPQVEIRSGKPARCAKWRRPTPRANLRRGKSRHRHDEPSRSMGRIPQMKIRSAPEVREGKEDPKDRAEAPTIASNA